MIIQEASNNAKQRVAILSLGTRLAPSIEAARAIEAATNGEVGVTVADARFMKPLDIDLVRELASSHEILVTVEEGSIGGFGDHVLHFLANDGALDAGELKVRPMVLPDRFFEAATQSQQYDEAGLNAKHIAAVVSRLIDPDAVIMPQMSEAIATEATIA